jgi:membrane protein implicated in regulation of membrane protease activity
MRMDELSRAVFEAAYASRPQRRLRVAAVALLILKHALRGILFSWPLYLLAAAALALPGGWRWLFGVLALPALALSTYILRRGVKEDFREQVLGRILGTADLRRILLAAAGRDRPA